MDLVETLELVWTTSEVMTETFYLSYDREEGTPTTLLDYPTPSHGPCITCGFTLDLGSPLGVTDTQPRFWGGLPPFPLSDYTRPFRTFTETPS